MSGKKQIKRIGIPRALLFYRYGAMWKELLSRSSLEVVVSPRTTEAILGKGLSLSVCDLCLPVKTMFGHVSALKDDVDALFIPRYISVEQKAYMCPKFIGMPDMVRAAIRNAPQVIDPVMDIKNSSVQTFLQEMNDLLEIRNPDLDEQIRALEMPFQRDFFYGEGELTIAVTGRPYLVLDSYMNRGVVRYLNELGMRVFYFIPDMFSVETTMNRLHKWVYWTMGKEVVTSVNSMLGNRDICGIINLVNSACGPDSFMVELINRSFALEGKPYMTLTIDEHTSEVGLQTRIEAFVDMAVKRREIHQE